MFRFKVLIRKVENANGLHSFGLIAEAEFDIITEIYMVNAAVDPYYVDLQCIKKSPICSKNLDSNVPVSSYSHYCAFARIS